MDIFKNCNIKKIEMKDFNEYWIYINANDDKEHIIKIQEHNFIDDLKALKNDQKKRLYLSCRMADIDMFKIENGYCIMWSPLDIIYQHFDISNSDFDKVINFLEQSIEA